MWHHLLLILFSLYILFQIFQGKKIYCMVWKAMSQSTYMMGSEIRETKIEKLSFPTGLLSSLFSVVLPQRALTPSTATRRRKIPEELCLFSSLSTIPTASVAFLTRIMPCRERQTVACSPTRGCLWSDIVHVQCLFLYLFNYFSQRTAFLSAFSLIPDILLLNFYLKIKQRPKKAT